MLGLTDQAAPRTLTASYLFAYFELTIRRGEGVCVWSSGPGLFGFLGAGLRRLRSGFEAKAYSSMPIANEK